MFEIRQGLGSDAAALAQMEQASTARGWNCAQIIRSLEGSDRVHVLLHHSDLAGYCVTRVIADELELLNIAIAQQLKGKGYATRLLDFVLNLPEFSTIQAVWLEVANSNNAAISFYRKVGFENISTRRNYYRRQGVVEDALVMKLTLR